MYCGVFTGLPLNIFYISKQLITKQNKKKNTKSKPIFPINSSFFKTHTKKVTAQKSKPRLKLRDVTSVGLLTTS